MARFLIFSRSHGRLGRSWWSTAKAVTALLMVIGWGSVIVGCRESAPQFDHDRVRAMSLEISRDVPTHAAMEDVAATVDELFGTPQTPKWPQQWMEGEDERNLVSLERLTFAAGDISSDQDDVHTGLYQKHCVICHGISGSGAGAASRFQVPYPRDFRAGIFKWKSTGRSEKPTREDISRMLETGIPGTPMPSFHTLPSSDREALIDYVIYLSVRGEVERRLLAYAVDMLEYDEEPPPDDLRIQVSMKAHDSQAGSHAPELSEGERAIATVINGVVQRWVGAEASPVPPQPSLEGDALVESVAHGRELFNGPIAGCAGCHGIDGAGGMPSLDYDDWTKEFTTRIGITPGDVAAVKPFRKAGALPPRTIEPRTLADGLFRGGDDPETLYRRIHHGIAGTPMPGIEIVDENRGTTGVSSRDVWDLVNFLEEFKK